MARIIYFAIRDKNLNAENGGTLVANLEEMKKQHLQMKPSGDWRLVISVHGSQTLIEGGGPDKALLDADDIRRMFLNDPDVERWRKTYGPTWTTLNACQVNTSFEKVVIESFNKPGASQTVQGLGQGCRPGTETMVFTVPGTKMPLRTRSQWSQFSQRAKADVLSTLAELNRKFGYFGGPPVPETHLLDYYFDEQPKGGWPVVTIYKDEADTGISFHNRAHSTSFLKMCQNVGQLTYTPRGP